MGRIITSSDIYDLVRNGKKELVLSAEDRITEIGRELLRREGIKIVSREEWEKQEFEQKSGYVQSFSARKIISQANPASIKFAVPETSVHSAKLEKTDPQFDFVIENGTAMLPEFGPAKINIAIKDGIISALGIDKFPAKQIVDATGLHILPGIIDPHTHMGLSAPLDTDLESESRSAILGGVTTIGCFFNQTGSYLPFIKQLDNSVAKYSRVDVIPHFTLRDELQLSELSLYMQEGISSFKMYMCGIPGMFPPQEDGFILKALNSMKQFPNKPMVCIHAENSSIVDFAATNKERLETRTLDEWRKTHPELAEEEALLRAAYFGKKTGIPIYIVHVSCKESIDAIKKIKYKGLFIETTSPYLSLDSSSNIGIFGKMLPPLRNEESRETLWNAVKEGYIDTIGTDNVTMNSQEKMVSKGLSEALPGYPALGTHLVSVLDNAMRHNVSLETIVPLMTMNPAKIFRVYPRKGTLLPGSDADIVLVDLKIKKTVNPAMLQSRSDFALHQGELLQGWPCGTIKGGKIIAWDGRLTDDVYRGKIIRR